MKISKTITIKLDEKDDPIAPDLEGVSLLVRKLDFEEQDSWVLKQTNVQIAETKRRIEERKKHDEKSAPEIFSDSYRTEQGLRDTMALARALIKEVVIGVEGVEDAEPMDVVNHLNVGQRMKLYTRILSRQGPDRRSVPPSSVPGDV